MIRCVVYLWRIFKMFHGNLWITRYITRPLQRIGASELFDKVNRSSSYKACWSGCRIINRNKLPSQCFCKGKTNTKKILKHFWGVRSVIRGFSLFSGSLETLTPRKASNECIRTYVKILRQKFESLLLQQTDKLIMWLHLKMIERDKLRLHSRDILVDF